MFNARTLAEHDLGKVWRRYWRYRSDNARNLLIEHYIPLVRYIAERLCERLPNEVQVDDLISAGIFGLNDGIASFDPDRRVKFETFSSPRIRGAMLDELRNMDWVPRLVRARVQQMRKVNTILHNDLGRLPTAEEKRKHLRMSPKVYARLERDSKVKEVVSLSRKYFETDSNKDVRQVDLLADERLKPADDFLEKHELFNRVYLGLSRAEKIIIALYYLENMTMLEISRTIDLSESRVSQIHSMIITRLRDSLEDYYDDNYVFINDPLPKAQPRMLLVGVPG